MKCKYNNFKSEIFAVLTCAFIAIIQLFLFSCQTFMPEGQPVSRSIAGRGVKSAPSLEAFFLSHCPGANRAKVRRMAVYYIEEASLEGINSDVAFVQMCHETNFLRFGNLVSADMNNFCGLGAIDAEHRGLSFETERLGVRAHIQHLHAYGTPESVKLNNPLIDTRYKYVRPRGKAPDIQGLTGTWAADKKYSEKLEKYLCELEGF